MLYFHSCKPSLDPFLSPSRQCYDCVWLPSSTLRRKRKHCAAKSHHHVQTPLSIFKLGDRTARKGNMMQSNSELLQPINSEYFHNALPNVSHCAIHFPVSSAIHHTFSCILHKIEFNLRRISRYKSLQYGIGYTPSYSHDAKLSL